MTDSLGGKDWRAFWINEMGFEVSYTDLLSAIDDVRLID
jgi:hypothetical protein